MIGDKTMKKILYALGLVTPLLTTSVNATDIDSFFVDEETAVKVVRYYDGEEGVKARVKGILGEVSHIVAFGVEGRLEDAGWKNDDRAIEATPLKIGNVDIGKEDFMRSPAIYGSPIPYTPLEDTEELQGDLTPGSIISAHTVQNWLRPDQTTYSIVGHALFRLRLEEDREVIGGEFKTLVKTWKTIKGRGFKSKKATRHLIQNYSQEKVTRTTTKLAVDEDEVLETSIVEFIALTKTRTYESWDNEANLSAGIVPAGYKVEL